METAVASGRGAEGGPALSLVMKQSCERCGVGLAPEGAALICSYECTFCPDCGTALEAICPNCGGELVARPRRAVEPHVA